MENFGSIEDKIQQIENEKIIKVKSNPLNAIILLIAGIIAIILGVIIIHNETLKLSVVLLGVVIAIVGLIYLLTKTGKNSFDYVYEPTGKKLKKYKVYLDVNDAKKIFSCINNNNFAGLKNIKKTMDSGHLMDVRGTDDGSVFLFQVLEYIPHDFVPSSPVIVLHGEDAKQMLDFVKS